MAKKIELEEQYEHGLEEIRSLERDLSAKIIIRPEIAHDESAYYTAERTGGGGGTHPYEYHEWKVIDREAVTKPDIEKIESARSRLRDIANSSDLFSLQYASRRVLGFEDVNPIVKNLEEALSSDLSTRQRALRDTGFLLKSSYSEENKKVQDLLRRTYQDNDSKQVRKEAYRMLHEIHIKDRMNWKLRSFDDGHGSFGLGVGILAGMAYFFGIPAIDMHFDVDPSLLRYLGGFLAFPYIGAMIGSIGERIRSYNLLMPDFQEWLKNGSNHNNP